MRTLGGKIHYIYGCFFAPLTACLCGCDTLIKPADVRQNHQTVVLARIVCVDDVHGKQHGPDWNFTFDTWQLGDARGQTKTSPVEGGIYPLPLPGALYEQGWFHHAMNPGSYCLRLKVDSDTTDNVDQPVLYLSVPANKPLVYAGTLVFHRTTRKQGSITVGSQVMDHVADESAAARSVCAAKLSGFGEMTTDLLTAYDSPAINSNEVVKAESCPPSQDPTPVIKGVDWFGPVVEAPAGDSFHSVGHETRAADAVGDAATGGAWFLVTAPVVLAIDGITDHAHEKKWAPYQAAFQKQVAEFHLDEKLQQALAIRLNPGGTNATTSPALRLEVQPHSIVLRDRHRKFSLEVAARVRLLSSTDGWPIWEHDYLCTHDGPGSTTAGIYQTFIPSWYGQHKLEEYRGDAGAELMQRELESFVGAITDKVIGELYDRGASSDPTGRKVAATAETPPQSPR
jgi:hypothetical protein